MGQLPRMPGEDLFVFCFLFAVGEVAFVPADEEGFTFGGEVHSSRDDTNALSQGFGEAACLNTIEAWDCASVSALWCVEYEVPGQEPSLNRLLWNITEPRHIARPNRTEIDILKFVVLLT